MCVHVVGREENDSARGFDLGSLDDGQLELGGSSK